MTQKVHGLCRESCRFCEPLLATRFPPISNALPAMTGEEAKNQWAGLRPTASCFFRLSHGTTLRDLWKMSNELAEPPDSFTALSLLTWRGKPWNERRKVENYWGGRSTTRQHDLL